MSAINTLRILRQLRKNQWLNTSELEYLQSKKHRAMTNYAYGYAEFYYAKFKNAYNVSD